MFPNDFTRAPRLQDRFTTKRADYIEEIIDDGIALTIQLINSKKVGILVFLPGLDEINEFE